MLAGGVEGRGGSITKGGRMKRGGERGEGEHGQKKRENLPGGNKPSIPEEEKPSLNSAYIIINAAILSTAKMIIL